MLFGTKHASVLKWTRSVNWRAAITRISSSATSTGSMSRPIGGSSSVCHLGRLRVSVFLPVVLRRDLPCCACPDSSCEHEVLRLRLDGVNRAVRSKYVVKKSLVASMLF